MRLASEGSRSTPEGVKCRAVLRCVASPALLFGEHRFKEPFGLSRPFSVRMTDLTLPIGSPNRCAWSAAELPNADFQLSLCWPSKRCSEAGTSMRLIVKHSSMPSRKLSAASGCSRCSHCARCTSGLARAVAFLSALAPAPPAAHATATTPAPGPSARDSPWYTGVRSYSGGSWGSGARSGPFREVDALQAERLRHRARVHVDVPPIVPDEA